MDKEKLKGVAIKEVDSRQDELRDLSLKIHSNPEQGFHEVQAAAWLTGYLEKNGFSVERGIYGLETAFRARYGSGRPAIALMAEYDSLPAVGHACGHNIISTSAAGAGVASKMAVDSLSGSVLVIGTPAEEIYGGKALMAERGAFSDLDIAMMVHPASYNVSAMEALACQTLQVEFFGRAAHAAAQPEAGINALEAMLLSFNAINSLRQHIRNRARIHGIITDGGKAANIVPDHSAGDFIVRAGDNEYLTDLKERVLDCFIGAATATGARLEYKWGDVCYSALRNNNTLIGLFNENMKTVGREMLPVIPGQSFGSTDMGNVSQLVPSIHPFIAITDVNVLIHSPQFAEAAASERAIEGLLDAAKALAMTVIDLLASPETVAKAKEEFTLGND
ncbi:MAG: M20 family metallopeptidase [Chloroflexi bacterium]|nr:M20 family metallopeptidase [Chloroflexota bacterium]